MEASDVGHFHIGDEAISGGMWRGVPDERGSVGHELLEQVVGGEAKGTYGGVVVDVRYLAQQLGVLGLERGKDSLISRDRLVHCEHIVCAVCGHALLDSASVLELVRSSCLRVGLTPTAVDLPCLMMGQVGKYRCRWRRSQRSLY